MTNTNKTKIGIIVADNFEVNNILNLLGSHTKKVINKNIFYIFNGNENYEEIIFSFSGIGKVNAAYTATTMINMLGVKAIINVGVAGTNNEDIKPLDFVIAEYVQYLDVDATAFNYKLNQIPMMPEGYLLNQQIKEKLKQLLPNAQFCKIGTADSFIKKSNMHRFPAIEQKQVDAIEMECCAIAQVCYLTNKDLIIAKYISDDPQNYSNNDEYEQSTNLAKNKIDKTILFFVNNKII